MRHPKHLIAGLAVAAVAAAGDDEFGVSHGEFLVRAGRAR